MTAIRSRWRIYLIASGPVVGAVVGALTNVLTANWNWWLFGGLFLAVSIAVAVVVQIEDVASRPREEKGAAGDAGGNEAVAAPHLLPPLAAHFTGRRDEIDTLRKVLDPKTRSTPGTGVAALFGQGGVGKTALAVRLGHLLAPAYPDGQLYIDLRGVAPNPVEPTDAIVGFLRALGVGSDAIPATFEDRQNLFRSVTANRRVLLVLDNAASATQVRPLLPGGADCGVVVTSRQPLGALETSAQLRVEVLPVGDSAELLQRVLGTDRTSAEPEALQEIVRLCGGLPLALRVAGGRLLMRRHWTLRDLVRLLSDDQRRLNALKVGDLEVRACISVSYEAQDQRRQRAFRMLGLLNFPDFPGWTAAAILDEDALQGTEVLESLCEAQLLEIAGRRRSGEIRYRFHDLIRNFARDFSLEHDDEQARRAAVARVLGGYLSLAETADSMLEPGVRNVDGDDAPRWPVDDPDFAIRELADDPQGWFAAERSNLVASVEHAAAAKQHKLTWELAGLFAAFFAVRVYPQEWEHTHLLGIDACLRSNDLRGEAFIRRSLGRLYRYQGRWAEARENYQRAFALFEQFDDRRWVAVVHRNLGDLDRDMGDYAGAEQDFERALEIFRGLDDKQWEAATLIGLGETYLAKGVPDEAATCFLACIPIFEAGGHKWWRAVALVEVGNAYAKLGRPEAEQYLKDGLDIFQELGDDRRTALTQLSLGRLWLRHSSRKQALPLLEECLRTFQAAGDRLCVARTLDAMGDFHLAEGRRRAAQGVWGESVNILRSINAPELAQVSAKLAAA